MVLERRTAEPAEGQGVATRRDVGRQPARSSNLSRRHRSSHLWQREQQHWQPAWVLQGGSAVLLMESHETWPASGGAAADSDSLQVQLNERPPPQLQQGSGEGGGMPGGSGRDPDQQDFFANVGDAIRTLREDYPLLFVKDLNCERISNRIAAFTCPLPLPVECLLTCSYARFAAGCVLMATFATAGTLRSELASGLALHAHIHLPSSLALCPAPACPQAHVLSWPSGACATAVRPGTVVHGPTHPTFLLRPRAPAPSANSQHESSAHPATPPLSLLTACADSIYREDLTFKDPNLTFHGLRTYRAIFWGLRLHGKLLLKAANVRVLRIWQPEDAVIK